MSYSTLYNIQPNGDVVSHQDFGNAFQGAMIVWMDMIGRYLGSPDTAAMYLMDDSKQQQLWDLVKDPRLPRHHKIVMLSTYDNRLCRSENFPS